MQQRKKNHFQVSREAQLKYMQNKREMKDVETFQVTALLTLLNPYCGIILECPRKQTVVTANLPVVHSLVFPNETINLSELADNVCRPSFESNIKKGMKRDSAIRRFEKNRRTFIHNFLFDILLEKNYFFNSKLSRRTLKTFRFERIETIFYDQKPILNYEEMITLGKNSMFYFVKCFDNEKSIFVEQNNLHLLSQHPLYNNLCSLQN